MVIGGIWYGAGILMGADIWSIVLVRKRRNRGLEVFGEVLVCVHMKGSAGVCGVTGTSVTSPSPL